MSYRRLKRILKRLGGSSSDDEDGEEDVATATDTTSAKLRRPPSSNFVSDLEAASFCSGRPASALSTSEHAKMPLMPTEQLLEQVERDFFDLLEEDIRRVNAHSASVLTKIEGEVQLLVSRAAAGHSQPHTMPLSHFYQTRVNTADHRQVREQYKMCSKLRSFATINHEGIRKIVKKYDKVVGADRQKHIRLRLSTEPFASSDAQAVREAAAKLEQLCTPEQLAELRATASSLGFMQVGGRSSGAVAPAVTIGLACVLSACVALLPLGASAGRDEAGHAQRCLALLVLVVTIWLTEALPYFATALLVPVGVVALDVLPLAAVPPVAGGHSPTRSDVAKLVLNSMFDKTILLVLSGLVAASVVARCSLERRLARFLQRSLGGRPRLFLLTLMEMVSQP